MKKNYPHMNAVNCPDPPLRGCGHARHARARLQITPAPIAFNGEAKVRDTESDPRWGSLA